MASTINATTSGIVTIGDSVATLSLQTGGTTAVAISTSQIVTLSKSLALLGSSSGSVTIAAPATAGTQSYTLPTAQPTANGQALTATTAGVMSWAAASATPGGSSTQVQYNNTGAFGGISGFTTDGTRVTASTTIGVGGATPSSSGSGVTFPATQDGSSNANTLDDYEEGTFTPILRGLVGNNATMSVQEGFYTKIGNSVFFQIQIVWSSPPVGDSLTFIGPIPFTAKPMAGGYGWAASMQINSSLTTPFCFSIEAGTTNAYWQPINNQTQIANSFLASSGRLTVNGSYITNL
jgi:hypothetical protein